MHRPRYFLRRAVAFIIDAIIASVVVSAMVVVLGKVTGLPTLPAEIFTRTTCEDVELVAFERLVEILDSRQTDTIAQGVCEITILGSWTYYRAIFRKIRSSEGDLVTTRQVTNYSFTTDAAGRPKSYISSGLPVVLISPVLLALLIWQLGSTFGKNFMGLEIAGSAGHRPTFQQAIVREYIKTIPVLVMATAAVVASVSMKTADSAEALLLQAVEFGRRISNLGTPVHLLVLAISTIAVVWFYFGSFIRWRGQAYWDRWSDLHVQLAEENDTSPDIPDNA